MTRINFARRAPLAASAFFIGLCAATGAQAQDAPAQPAQTAQEGEGENILVTAQRRDAAPGQCPAVGLGDRRRDARPAERAQLRRLCAARARPHPHPGKSGRDAAHPSRRQHRLGRLVGRHLCRRYAVRRERQPFERRHPRRRFRHVRRGAGRGAARTAGNALRRRTRWAACSSSSPPCRTPTVSRRAPRSASRTRATARSASSATRWSMSRSATRSPSAQAASIARIAGYIDAAGARRDATSMGARAMAAARRCC